MYPTPSGDTHVLRVQTTLPSDNSARTTAWMRELEQYVQAPSFALPALLAAPKAKAGKPAAKPSLVRPRKRSSQERKRDTIKLMEDEVAAISENLQVRKFGWPADSSEQNLLA